MVNHGAILVTANESVLKNWWGEIKKFTPKGQRPKVVVLIEAPDKDFKKGGFWEGAYRPTDRIKIEKDTDFYRKLRGVLEEDQLKSLMKEGEIKVNDLLRAGKKDKQNYVLLRAA